MPSIIRPDSRPGTGERADVPPSATSSAAAQPDISTIQSHFRVTTELRYARSVAGMEPNHAAEGVSTVSKAASHHPTEKALLTAVAVTLALTTAYIHFSLGGTLFVLNAAGYLGLALLLVIGVTVPHPIVARFAWVPGLGLAGYAAVTIVSYLIIGPYFALGWIAKGVEVALIGVVAAQLIHVYGSATDVGRAAMTSLQMERRTS